MCSWAKVTTIFITMIEARQTRVAPQKGLREARSERECRRREKKVPFSSHLGEGRTSLRLSHLLRRAVRRNISFCICRVMMGHGSIFLKVQKEKEEMKEYINIDKNL